MDVSLLWVKKDFFLKYYFISGEFSAGLTSRVMLKHLFSLPRDASGTFCRDIEQKASHFRSA